MQRRCTSTPTSRSLLVQYTPTGLNIRKCTPSLDEVYIRTPPSPFVFPLFLFALLPRPHVWRQIPIYYINSLSLFEFIRSKDRTHPHGTSGLRKKAVTVGKVSKLHLYIGEEFLIFPFALEVPLHRPT